ncbi:Chaperone protein HscA-like protein [Bienertia sinuspersici]
MDNHKELFTINFISLLSNILKWYELPEPLYRQYHKKGTKRYVTTIELSTQKDETTITISSKSSKDLATATNHAARLAIEKLKQCYVFDIADFNLSSIRREREKRRKADIKRVEKQMSLEDLNTRYNDVCHKNQELIDILRNIKKLGYPINWASLHTW